MNTRTDERWERLIALLEPVHRQAVATARRLSRSVSEGDDLYQETVLQAFEKLHTLRDPSRFRSWFYATLLNRHRSRWRRSFWRRFVPWDAAFPEGKAPADPTQGAGDDRVLRSARMSRALATLAAAQREAIVLFELENFSIEEIASLQGASISAVKSRLARGREALRRFYLRLELAPERVQRSAGGPVGPPDLAGFTPLPAMPVPAKERSDE